MKKSYSDKVYEQLQSFNKKKKAQLIYQKKLKTEKEKSSNPTETIERQKHEWRKEF